MEDVGSKSNGRSDNRDVLAGIRLTLEEIRDLKRELAEDCGPRRPEVE